MRILYCKLEVTLILKLLSLHPVVDLDPRMICLNPHLYWSVIWFFGSVTKALKEIGGDSLYNAVFKNDFNVGANEEAKKELFKRNFVSEMDLEDKSYRYCCSSYLCHNLEDKEKFLTCEGCVTTIRRKYCSGICQRLDKKQHKKYCSIDETEENTNASKWSNKSKKKKKNKRF